MNPGTLTVYRWELRKLRAQKRTYLGLGAAALVPIIFVVALVIRGDSPNDVAFGHYVHDTGLAIPLVLLLFGSVWMFPLITALVAGDIVAAEDRNQTLKTILTRSVERQQIFAGKTLATFTYAVAAIAVTGVVALVAGILASGFNSIVSLSGTRVSATEGLVLVGASLAVYLIPIVAIACVGLLFSTVFRNSAAAIVGTLMFSLLVQLIGILPGLGRAPPLPAEHPVQRLAGASALADRLGADRPRRLGLRALRGAGADRRRPRLPAPRRGRGLSRVAEGVLIVEDDAPVRRMLERSLGAEGFEVRSAADGGSGPGDGRGVGTRPRRARRDDAGTERDRRLPAAAREGAERRRPDADRPRRGRGPGARPRRRRRRLRGQAVRDRRGGGAAACADPARQRPQRPAQLRGNRPRHRDQHGRSAGERRSS